VSRDGSAWQDLRKRSGFDRSDVCLKAFVTSSGSGDRFAPKVVVEAVEAPAGTSAHVRFTLTDPPFSCGSAVVKLWLRDRHGTTVRQARIPAVAVGEREIWRFVAPQGRGAYHIVARAWDVAGHRQVSLSRAAFKVL
jgi:hypothetical protein